MCNFKYKNVKLFHHCMLLGQGGGGGGAPIEKRMGLPVRNVEKNT